MDSYSPAERDSSHAEAACSGRLPSVSVVIPVHEGLLSLGDCVRSVQACVPPPAEIIVVADGEAVDLSDLASHSALSLLRVASRSGPATARNKGASEARGDVLLFVDADVTVPADTVGRVAEVLGMHPELTAVFGSYDDSPADPGFLSQYRNLLHHYVHQAGNMEASTFWSACGAVRREAFFAVGGFREHYREACLEDVELGLRLRAADHRIRLLKELQVKHLKRWTAAAMLRTDIFRRALPWTSLVLRQNGLVDDLNLKMSNRVSTLAAMLLPLTVLAGLFRGWFLGLAALCCVVLLALNRRLYGFFRRRKGVAFALAAIPWHWLYFLYSGLAFGIGVLLHLFRSRAA